VWPFRNPPPEPEEPRPKEKAHANITLAYERAKQLESSIQAITTALVARIAATIAVFGFIVAGANASMDRLIWGVQQVKDPDVVAVNILMGGAAIMVSVLAVRWLLNAADHIWLIFPWPNEMKDPAILFDKDPDEILAQLTRDLTDANIINESNVRGLVRKQVAALRSLFLSASLLLVLAGYNGYHKGIVDTLKADGGVQCGTIGSESLRPFSAPAKPPSSLPRLMQDRLWQLYTGALWRKRRPSSSTSPPLTNLRSTRAASGSSLSVPKSLAPKSLSSEPSSISSSEPSTPAHP
jgi:hypothetical protein